MLEDAITFTSFSVDDLQKAKEFYSTTLGVPIGEEMPGMISLKTKGAGDISIFVKEHHVPATFTILNFQVDDIVKTMERLSQRGVVFERYSGEEGIFTDKKGVAEFEQIKVSWFKDPAGNLLQLLQMPVQ